MARRARVELKMPQRKVVKDLADLGMSYSGIAICVQYFNVVHEEVGADQMRKVARAMGHPPRKSRGRPVFGGYKR